MTSRRPCRLIVPVLTFLAGCLAVCFEGTIAQGQTRKVTVQARGAVDAKPDQLVFSVNLTKSAGTEKKAKDNFDEIKKDFLSAFNVMKFKGLSLRSTSKFPVRSQPSFVGPMIGGAPPIAFGGGGGGFGGAAPVPAEPQFYAAETFQLTVDGIDKMTAETVETQIAEFSKELKSLGLTPAGGFSTRLKSQSPFMKKAFAKALLEAKDKASELAKLTDSKIGKVVEIMESSSFVQPAFNAYNPYGMVQAPMISYSPASTGVGISSRQTVVAALRVTFELTD